MSTIVDEAFYLIKKKRISIKKFIFLIKKIAF